MVVQLGAGFTTPAPPQPPTGDERRHEELLAELAAVREALWALAQQGPPQITVPPQDLTEILYALDGLGVPGLPAESIDPRAIGEAVAQALGAQQIQVPDRTDEVLEELKRIGRKFGLALANSAPLVSQDVSDRTTRELGEVSVTNLPALQKVQLDPAVSHYTSTTGALRVAQGRVWLAGSRQTVSLTNPTSSIVMMNPAGSGKNVQVFHFNVTGTVAGDVDFFHTHSDISTFGAAVTPLNPNHYFDAATSSAQVRAGTGQPTGIDVRSPIRRVNTQSPVEFDGLIILGPGHGFGLRVGGATGDGAFYMNARWIEDPV